MMKHTSTQIAVAFAVALAATACNKNTTRDTAARETNGRDAAANSTATNTAADQRNDKNKPITLTGCLQQDGGTYIVTRVNEPSRKGAGSSGNGAAVEQEQLRSAANAYRVDSKGRTDWDNMVGKEVRVSGSIEEAADLPTATTASRDTGRTGSTDAGNRDAGARENIDKGDLAKIDVTAMTVVSDNCGKGATQRSTRNNRQ
jgi:hypothetical protein